MEYLILFLLAVLIAGVGLLFFLLLRKKPEAKDSQSLLMLQQQLSQLGQILDSKLSQSAKSMQTQFGQSAKIIRQVTEKLTKLDDTNRQVVGFAEQLQSFRFQFSQL